MKKELSYFLDHPQIKRNKSLGNGNKPGSIAEKINFGGKNTKPTPKKESRPTASSGKESKGNVFTNFMSFGKKKDK